MVTDPQPQKPSVMNACLAPQRLRDVGETPDYRFSLANERTFLAWLRTSLALAGGGIAVAQFLPVLRIPGLREVIAIVLLVLAAACAIRAVAHWVACELAMRQRRDLPVSRFPVVLGLLVCAGAVGLLAAVAVGVFSA